MKPRRLERRIQGALRYVTVPTVKVKKMNPLSAALIGAAILVVVFALAWAQQLRTNNAGMVDPVWSYSLGFLAVLYAVLSGGDGTARVVVAILGGAWGIRLGTHLFLRNTGKPEDGRYKRFREQWGEHAARNMFWFFQMQVVFAMLLSTAFGVVAFRDTAPAPALIAAGIAVWILSVVGEGVADWQLEQFKKDPSNKGKVCQVGLWRYSRHPNYFFECVHWLAYVVLAIGTPWIWLTLLAPAVMAFLLLKVSGIPLTEAQTAKSRPAYAEYMRTTSAFIPWPPKKTG